MNKDLQKDDIYMGLDKELVRDVVNIASLKGEEFIALPAILNITREDNDVNAEIKLSDEVISIDIPEEQKNFLKENINAFGVAKILKVKDELIALTVFGTKEEEMEEEMQDLVVTNFI